MRAHALRRLDDYRRALPSRLRLDLDRAYEDARRTLPIAAAVEAAITHAEALACGHVVWGTRAGVTTLRVCLRRAAYQTDRGPRCRAHARTPRKK